MSNFFNSFVVAAAMIFIALIQGIIALFDLLRHRFRSWSFVVRIIACFLIAGLAGCGTLNAPAQASPNSSAQSNSSTITTNSQAPSSTSTTNAVIPSPTLYPTPGKTPTSLAQKTYPEQEGSLGASTFTNPYNPSGDGPKVGAKEWVQVSCKVYAPQVQSANPDGYWYRIASSPWNNAYYAVANTFMNGDPWGGPYTHNTDFNVPNC